MNNNNIYSEGFYTRVYICPDCQREVPIGENVYTHKTEKWGILDHTVCKDCHDKIMGDKCINS